MAGPGPNTDAARTRRQRQRRSIPDSAGASLALQTLSRVDFGLVILSRVEWRYHGNLRCVNRHFRDVLRSDAFRRHRAAAGFLEDVLMILGGETSNTWILLDGAWRRAAPMPQPHCMVDVAVDGNKAYTIGCPIGGLARRADDAFVYCIDTNEWRRLPDTLSNNAESTLAVCGHRLVALNTYDPLGTIRCETLDLRCVLCVAPRALRDRLVGMRGVLMHTCTRVSACVHTIGRQDRLQ